MANKIVYFVTLIALVTFACVQSYPAEEQLRRIAPAPAPAPNGPVPRGPAGPGARVALTQSPELNQDLKTDNSYGYGYYYPYYGYSSYHYPSYYSYAYGYPYSSYYNSYYGWPYYR